MEDKVPTRLHLSEEQIMSLDRNTLCSRWIKQEQYVDYIENKRAEELRQLQTRLDTALRDIARKDKLMRCKLSVKERTIREYASELQTLRHLSSKSVSSTCCPSSSTAAAAPSAAVAGSFSTRQLLLDPAVNCVVERLRQQLEATRQQLDQTQSELSAWKFTPDSQTGKRLMAKCRLLHQENEELGKMVCSGRVAKLEAELALQRNLTHEMKNSQSEVDELVQELDDDVEAMQSTIVFLQQQLKTARAQLTTPPPPAAPLPSASVGDSVQHGWPTPITEPVSASDTHTAAVAVPLPDCESRERLPADSVRDSPADHITSGSPVELDRANGSACQRLDTLTPADDCTVAGVVCRQVGRSPKQCSDRSMTDVTQFSATDNTGTNGNSNSNNNSGGGDGDGANSCHGNSHDASLHPPTDNANNHNIEDGGGGGGSGGFCRGAGRLNGDKRSVCSPTPTSTTTTTSTADHYTRPVKRQHVSEEQTAASSAAAAGDNT